MTTPEHAQSAEWAQTVRLSRLLDQIAENARAHEARRLSIPVLRTALWEQARQIVHGQVTAVNLRLTLVTLAGLALAWLVQIDEESGT